MADRNQKKPKQQQKKKKGSEDKDQIDSVLDSGSSSSTVNR